MDDTCLEAAALVIASCRNIDDARLQTDASVTTCCHSLCDKVQCMTKGHTAAFTISTHRTVYAYIAAAAVPAHTCRECRIRHKAPCLHAQDLEADI